MAKVESCLVFLAVAVGAALARGVDSTSYQQQQYDHRPDQELRNPFETRDRRGLHDNEVAGGGDDPLDVFFTRWVRFQDPIPPKEITAGPHQSVTIECVAGGSPPPSMYWLKNGERIHQGDEHKAKMTGVGSTKLRLFLDCITEKDDGIYSCVAETPYERITTDTKLTVTETNEAYETSCDISKRQSGLPARIFMWTGHHIEVEGGDVRLLCRHSGFPQAKVTWYGPENNLVGHKPSGKYKIMRNGDLVVSHSSWLEDMGEFKCVVSNPYGRDEASTFFYPAMADDSEGF